MEERSEIEGLREAAKLLIKKLNLQRKELAKAFDPNAIIKFEEDIKDSETRLKDYKQKIKALQTNPFPATKDFEATLAADEDKELKRPELKLALHHQFTCDRNDQQTVFVNSAYNTDKKLHFYYLYGNNRQEHRGLYKRFYYNLAGKNLDFQKDYIPSKITAVDFDAFQYPRSKGEEAVQIEITTNLMKMLGIEEYEMEQALEKNLAFVLAKSPILQKLKATDKVCCFIRIPERRWKVNATPKIVHWFIEHFCMEQLPADAPDFYFFFSVEYKVKNEKIKKEEVEKGLKNETYTEHTEQLGELEMVTIGDVEDWLDDYEEIWEDPLVREGIIEDNFEDKDMDMYEVQKKLENIINKVNNSEKNAARNS